MAGGCRAMMSGRAMLGDERAGEGESGYRAMMSGRLPCDDERAGEGESGFFI